MSRMLGANGKETPESSHQEEPSTQKTQTRRILVRKHNKEGVKTCLVRYILYTIHEQRGIPPHISVISTAVHVPYTAVYLIRTGVSKTLSIIVDRRPAQQPTVQLAGLWTHVCMSVIRSCWHCLVIFAAPTNQVGSLLLVFGWESAASIQSYYLESSTDTSILARRWR